MVRVAEFKSLRNWKSCKSYTRSYLQLLEFPAIRKCIQNALASLSHKCSPKAGEVQVGMIPFSFSIFRLHFPDVGL
jgi:hypothetical protein